MYSVEAYNVNKKRGKNIVLEDVNFKLEKGKIYGLVGSNGSGKSTLLEIILHLCDSTGEVFLNGYNIKDEYNKALESTSAIVDYVSFYEFLTAYENLRYFSYVYNTPFERIKTVMDLVKLDYNNKQVVKKFSLGMKQRLGIAISLLKDPAVLILDEPTNGLDPIGIKDLRDLLLSFKDKTIIVSSHIISEIEKIVDSVLFIHNKKVYLKEVRKEKKINFKVDNYDVLTNLGIENNTYMDDSLVSDNVKTLVRNNVNVYRVEESDSLEDMLINMMGDK